MPWALIGNKLAEVVAGFPTERRQVRRIMERAIVVAKELELSNVDITQLEIPGMNIPNAASPFDLGVSMLVARYF